MTTASARQWERVEYQAPIQLSVQVGGPERPRTLHARAVNVSEGGIQVRTDDPLPLGEPVICSMLLEGRPAALQGRVRWTRSTAPGFKQPGAGIQFDELSELDHDLLRHLVARGTRGEQPVELFFPTMSEPVHARAFTSDGGLYITAALPLLTREAPVEFRFSDAGPRFKGRIARVAVRERGLTPHLEVELAIHAREAPRFRRYTMYDDSDAVDIGAATSGEAIHATPGVAPRVRVRAATLRVWDSPRAPTSDEPAAEPAIETRLRVLTPTVPVPKRFVARMPHAALALLIGSGVALVCTLMAWTLFTPGEPPPRAAGVAAVASPVTVQAVAALSVPRVSAPPPVRADIAAPARPSPALSTTLGPLVRLDHSTSEVTIPISGSLDGMISKRWASPLAVIVELPNATLSVPASASSSKVGLVTRITLAQAQNASRVRIFLAAPARSHDVQLRSGMLVIRIEPDLRGQSPIRP